MRSSVVTLVLVAVTAMSAQAQSLSVNDSSHAAPRNEAPVVAPQAGPTIASASVAMKAAEAPARNMAMEPSHKTDQATARMIVGGAAILTGIVVGGTPGYIISVGGAVVGLVGLYQYLQ